MFQGMNPKLVKQAMKKMGVKEVPIDAIEVIIKTHDKDLVIRNPGVTKVTMMGQETIQITGDIEEFSSMNEEDIKTVMSQASCTEEQAKEALEKNYICYAY